MTARAAVDRRAVAQSIDTEAEFSRNGNWRLDERLIGVHNVFVRLARPELGPLHAMERIRIMKEHAGASTVRLAGLVPDEGALLDCMIAAPEYERGFAKVLYWHRGAVREKCARLGIGKTKYFSERDQVLNYFRAGMHTRGFRV